MSNLAERTYWRRCSTCKQSLDFGKQYWVCNVSTCNRKRTGLVFCSVECWDAHVPLMNHRESWAEERVAPSKEAALAEEVKEAASASSGSGGGAVSPKSSAVKPVPSMTMGAPAAQASGPQRRMATTSSSGGNREILVVASKVKEYIRAKADFNTSQEVMDILSDIIRAHCEDAIQRAREDGRKTVLDRDIKF